MRKLTVAIVLATTALSGSALARDKAWYVGIEGGGLLAEDYRFNLRDTAGNVTPNAIRANHSAGFDVDGNVGYDFGLLRTEFEVSYKDANVKSLTFNQATPGLPVQNADGSFSPGTVSPSVWTGAYGYSRSLSFMANAMLDVGDQNGWSAFAGGGVGVARVELSKLRYYRQAPNLVDDSDTHFAWQIVAGARRHITDNVDLGIKYRFFNVPDIKFHDVAGDELKDEAVLTRLESSSPKPIQCID